MNTSELQCCIACDSVLRGLVNVYASDYLPYTLNRLPYGIIVNTDVHYKPGTHWCAIFFDGKGNTEFFDSYGHPPDHYGYFITHFLKQNCKKPLIVNRKRLQSNFSNVYGMYCLFYLHQRFQGLSMKDIFNSFSPIHFSLNDMYIYNISLRVYPYCINNQCIPNQTCKPLLTMPS